VPLKAPYALCRGCTGCTEGSALCLKGPNEEFKYADIEPVSQKKPEEDRQEIQDAGYAGLPAEAWCMHARLYDYTQETQLGPP
jgi:hypothetical protein